MVEGGVDVGDRLGVGVGTGVGTGFKWGSGLDLDSVLGHYRSGTGGGETRVRGLTRVRTGTNVYWDGIGTGQGLIWGSGGSGTGVGGTGTGRPLRNVRLSVRGFLERVRVSLPRGETLSSLVFR